MIYSGDSSEISSARVRERIRELLNSTGYAVVLLRTGEVISKFTESAGAAKFIDDEDYNPERVIVRQEELSAGDASELSQLRELSEDAYRIFGASWETGDFTLYDDDYFSETWAKSQARAALLLLPTGPDLDDFPFSSIDWEIAAEDRRDRICTRIEFAGRFFYGRN